MTRILKKKFLEYVSNNLVDGDSISVYEKIANILANEAKRKQDLIIGILGVLVPVISNVFICLSVLTFERYAPVVSKVFNWVKPTGY